ncbi:hemagglutinin protein [Dyella tabacisoli]|uniref:Hemagglutinin protein n=1 Tax=Dyella tabacisoli TaxID=2282381 RepID=A0A369UQF9_9GAMM|nr:hemagglutinin protein [Dyella tabacisoli]RDD83004.1 hemagglutinin protein [Dyella tabacisoli]
MSTPSFTRVDALNLYALSTATEAAVPGYWAGYRPGSAGSLPNPATLTDTWNDAGGVYVFINATPTDMAAFLTALDGYLHAIAATSPRFLWISNPLDLHGYWQTQTLSARSSGQPGALTWSSWGQNNFSLQEYALQLAPGTALTLSSSGGNAIGVAIASSGMRFMAPAIMLTPVANSGGLAFAGTQVGAFTAGLSLPGGDAVDRLAALGVRLRYVIRASADIRDIRVVNVDMPVLAQSSQALTLDLTWDPLNPLLRGRGGLRFTDRTATPLDATLVTTRGYATKLTPQIGSAPLWSAGFMFCSSPLAIGNRAELRSSTVHLAPDGIFTLSVIPPSHANALTTTYDRLMLGQSGLEYVGLTAQTGMTVLFEAGQPAFAPTAALQGVPPGEQSKPLSALATTAYMNVLPAASGQNGLTYFAQPRQAPLFIGSGNTVMAYQEVPAATLPAYPSGSGNAPATFPVGLYSGVDVSLIAAARALELSALAPARRQSMALPSQNSAPAAVPATDLLALTPQGLVVTIASDLSKLSGVVIANMPASSIPTIAFNRVDPPFQAALQANQLFFVASNVTTLLDSAGIAAPFAADIEGWHFKLAPTDWRTDPTDHPTLMLFKYGNRSLEDLVADTACWGWQPVATNANGKILPTQLNLAAIFAAAKARKDIEGDPYGLFYRETVANPMWNGVLFFNVPVDFTQMPEPLQFLAAGIDTTRFYAHHIGFSVTPFNPTTTPVSLGQTAAFGLIDYQDPVDLVPEATHPFAFKTLALRARFANAQVADFSAQAELAVNRLFGAQAVKQDPSRGNNLILDGSYQNVGGLPAYAFALRGENLYNTLNSALTSVEVLGVRLQSQSAATSVTVTTRFVLAGNLRFYAPPGFDALGYGPAPGTPATDGYLRFANFAVSMSFARATPTTQLFVANETGMSFDLPNSVSRGDALVANFPVTVSAMVASPDLALPGKPPEGQSPEDMGFTSIYAPMPQAILTPPWYGLALNLDLGTLGALSGSVGMQAQLLIAWCVGRPNDDLPMYLGLRLPSSPVLGGSLPLQGVLRLGFRSFQFNTYLQNGHRAYMLRMRRFALSILGWHFPPGNLDVMLFGGPDGRSTGQLGWMAAYDPGKQKKNDLADTATSRPSPSARRVRRLSAGRRLQPPNEP